MFRSFRFSTFAIAVSIISAQAVSPVTRRLAEAPDADVPDMEAKVEFFERHSRELFGREMRAIEDPACQSADTFVGVSGITWLQRWALTKKMPKTFFAGEPEVPAFVADNAKP